MSCFNKQVKCTECHYEFVMAFISDDDKVVNRIDPDLCPECGSSTFIGEFTTNPGNWFGVMGYNG